MKTLLTIFLLTFLLSTTYAQVGINSDNTAPHSSAMLDVKSITKAFYPPRMTTAQKDAIVSKQAGAVVFDITLNQLSFYNGSSWVAAAGGGLTLPYNQSASSFTGYDGGLFKVTNTLPVNAGESVAINGTITGNDGYAIRAIASNTSPFLTGAIYGTNASTNENGFGIWGYHAGGGQGIIGGSNSGIGVSGISTSGSGVKGESNNLISGIGVWGKNQGSGNGVFGQSLSGYGVYGYSNSGNGLYGYSVNGVGAIIGSQSSHALITGGGNVGIGVSNPSTILDIKSRMRIRNSTETAGIYFDGTANTYKGFIGLETDNLTGLYGFNGAEWAVKMDNTTGEWMATKGLSVGGGSKIGKIIRASVALDISSITSNTVSSISLPFIDAQVGDQVMVTGSGNLAPVVIGNCYVSTPGFVNVFFINNSNVNVDPALMSYLFTLIR